MEAAGVDVRHLGVFVGVLNYRKMFKEVGSGNHRQGIMNNIYVDLHRK